MTTLRVWFGRRATTSVKKELRISCEGADA